MMFVPATVGILECADELKSRSYSISDHYRSFYCCSNDRYRKVAQFMMESAEKQKGEMIK